MPEREQNTGGQYEKGFNKTEKSVRHGTAYESESDRKNQRFYLLNRNHSLFISLFFPFWHRWAGI